MISMRRLAFFCALFAALTAAAQQTTLLVDVDHRPQTSLNGPWHYMADPFHDGWGNNPDHPGPNGYAKNSHYVPGGPLIQFDFSRSPTLNVPGDWNTQEKSLFYYEGLLWYQRDFEAHPQPHTHLFLHFGAVNYAAWVFVNDLPVCHHEGGFTPFDCDIGAAAKDGNNYVVVAVDNQRTLPRVPTLKSDWWNYGGLTAPVSLVEVPDTYIDDYSLQLQRGTANHLEGYVHLTGAAAGTPVTLRIPDLSVEKVATTDTNGRAAFSFDAPNLALWSPDHPRLYKIAISAGPDALADDIGFRTIEVHGDQILLNGQPIFLRGISFHDEAPLRGGRAWSEQDAATLLGWAHDLHCNFVRMAHYPHAEPEYRLADKLGILVWSEIPVYWAIDWTDPATLANAQQQLHEMIRRDHNHAAVIFWSLSNETPESPDRNAFLHQLAVQARTEDPTRLITSAIVTHFRGKTAVLDDPLGNDLDVLGYNEYLGWYQGSPDDIPTYTWQNPMNKPVIISEFGAGAKAGLHGPDTQMFTEEYQDRVFRQQFKMLANIPFLRGMTPWVLMDFRSPLRPLPGIQDGYNRKGLVSDKGEKKKAFFTLQRYYENKQP
ncbi:MAG TPA: glycoside hydrolase family 2 TIM barrel-domain containing protein [Acidobacteriaceae bacterium]|jgi:beta-glucuronidase|nr:glycoside hydrolase family 2 TIM barrel-domain containing protein [Acidobacteriaceae bacterium]